MRSICYDSTMLLQLCITNVEHNVIGDLVQYHHRCRAVMRVYTFAVAAAAADDDDDDGDDYANLCK